MFNLTATIRWSQIFRNWMRLKFVRFDWFGRSKIIRKIGRKAIRNSFDSIWLHLYTKVENTVQTANNIHCVVKNNNGRIWLRGIDVTVSVLLTLSQLSFYIFCSSNKKRAGFEHLFSAISWDCSGITFRMTSQ